MVCLNSFRKLFKQQEGEGKMKNRRFSNWIVGIILSCCLLAVVFFPYASDNREIYKAIIYTSIVIVLFLLLYLIKVHVFESNNHKQVADQ